MNGKGRIMEGWISKRKKNGKLGNKKPGDGKEKKKERKEGEGKEKNGEREQNGKVEQEIRRRRKS